VELLKQDQYVPRNVVQQVTAIFAGVNGLMDDIPVELCREFEIELSQYLETHHSAIVRDIAEKQQITPETEQQLRSAIEMCKSNFLSRAGAA
jgi:F-type H+-transporting ATPase subunit alpha